MTQKEFKKHNLALKEVQEFNYCNAHNVSLDEYKKAKNKNQKIQVGIVGAEIGILALLMAIFGISATYGVKPKVTTPVIDEKALRFEEPLRAYEPGFGNMMLNMTSTIVYNEADAVICLPYDTGNVYGSAYRDYTASYFIWSENSTSSIITQDYSYNPDNFTSYDELYVYDLLKSNKLYLDFSQFNLSQDYTFNRWLLNGVVPSKTQTRTYENTYEFDYNFRLNFTDEYNLYSNRTYKGLKFRYDTIIDEYSYKYGLEVYAVPFSSSDKEVMIFSNYDNGYNGHIVTSDYLGVRFESNKYGTNLYLAPYLVDSSLTFATDNPLVLDRSNLLLRPFLNEEYVNNAHIRIVYEADNSNLDLWSNFGDLFLIFWTAITPILSIQILPMVTIGGLIIAPLILGFIALLLALIKK